ncbi:MAG: type II CAAX endopeptidase family protein [Candidatus Omnitrophota bacterium]|nr:type II CAAX endopeptidase family protein [Candidatus Omnitrophota bacterium]
MNKKRNIYILLTLPCLIAIISLQAILPTPPHKELKLSLDTLKLLKNPNSSVLEILTVIYLAILIIGFGNLISFTIRNFRKKILPIAVQQSRFTLSEENASKLILSIILLILVTYLFEIIILLPKWKINIKALPLFLNFAVEVGVIMIIMKFISLKTFGFNLKKRCFSFTLKSYITILPVILGLFFLNYSILEKMGMRFSLNPVIGLFLSLKDNFLVSILLLQIILFGPLAEELFFRGFLYNLAKQKYGFVASALIVSSIFAMLHRNPQEIFPLFILSAAMCYIYERTQNIASPIIFHILHNSLSMSFLIVIKNLT